MTRLFKAEDYGILPGGEVAQKLARLFDELSGVQGGYYLKDCKDIVISGNKIIGRMGRSRFIRAKYVLNENKYGK